MEGIKLGREVRFRIADSNVNPFMPNVFSHPYQLEESISNFRVVGWYFSFLFIFSRNFCKQTVDNLIRRCVFAASDLVINCLPISHKMNARFIWVKFLQKHLLPYIYGNELKLGCRHHNSMVI